jgi:hypothetical protein
MARIRTIKPEFFTSEDIVGLSPLARLLYIATWCEADKEGRLGWKPTTFKLRYFPGDECDIQSLCQELVHSSLIVLYGDGLAYIPSFNTHQHINPRESDSKLPEPDASSRVATRQTRDIDAQGGREGKERKGTRDESRQDDPPGFAEFWKTWPSNDRKQAKGKCLEAWKKAHAERDAALILAHVESLKTSASWKEKGGQFIPAPLVYLNNRRWEGAEPASASGAGTLGMFV